MTEITDPPEVEADEEAAKDWGRYMVLLGAVWTSVQVAQAIGGRAFGFLTAVWNLGQNVSAENTGEAVSLDSGDGL